MSITRVLVPLLLCAAAAALAVSASHSSAPDGQAASASTSIDEKRGWWFEHDGPLRDGTIVTLRAAGVPSGLALTLVPCGTSALKRSSPTACDYRHAQSTLTNEDGTVSFNFPATRHVTVDEETIDCATSACSLSVLARTEPTTELFRSDMTFSATDDVAFVVDAEPNISLSHLDTVVVSGTWEFATVQECVDDVCDIGTALTSNHGPVEFAVIQEIVGADGEKRSCIDDECVLRVTNDHGVVDVALSFRRADPLPGPTLTVVPNEAPAEVRFVTIENLIGTWYRIEGCDVAFLAASANDVRCETTMVDPIWGPAATVTVPVTLPNHCRVLCELRLTSGAGDSVLAITNAEPVGAGPDETTIAQFTTVRPVPGGVAELAMAADEAGTLFVALCARGAATTTDTSCTNRRRKSYDAGFSKLAYQVGETIVIEETAVSCHALDGICEVVAELDDVVVRSAVGVRADKAPALSTSADLSALQVNGTDATVVVLACMTTPEGAEHCDAPTIHATKNGVLPLSMTAPSEACPCRFSAGIVDGSARQVDWVT